MYFDLFRKDYRADGLHFDIPRELTTRSFRARFLFDVYEQEERALLRRHLPVDSALLELGACIGVVSCISNSMLHSPTDHVVVEANPHLIPWIETNRTKNHARFSTEQCLVSRTSDGTFYIHHVIVGGSAERQTPHRITVPVDTVEGLEAKHNLRFNALVMDIEGGELAFLLENPTLLSRLNFVCVELHEFAIGKEGVATCRRILANAGLRPVGGDAASSAWLRP